MTIEEALPLLYECVGIPFRRLFADLPEDLVTNKGNVGQLLLKKIGIGLDSALTDFDDGELKTNKSDVNGVPKETMFITQISKQIDTLVSSPPQSFEHSNLYKKIRRLVFLPVCKDTENSKNWFFVTVVNVNLTEQKDLRLRLKDDYYKICHKLKQDIEYGKDGYIHTSNGDFIQVRSKDTKPYHPIYSEEYNRNISNKNHAFYFKKEFINYAKKYGN